MNGREICPGVWHFEEDYRVYCTLLQGKDLAILWDTGQGRRDLAAYVSRRVATPCLVLNSHGHSDHTGGNFRFPLVYAPRPDWPMLQGQSRMTGQSCGLAPLEAGETFDLGGMRARVVSLAGHTRGSVGLLLERERLLLAGDGLNPTLLLLGREAASLGQLRRTLEAAEKLPFDRYLSSHSPGPLGKKQLGLHLRHLDCLSPDPPARPGQYGPRVCRSEYKEAGGRSVIFFDRRLLERDGGNVQ